jgi:hypothetical protein
MAPQRNISVSKLARLLHMDRHTLSYYLRLYNVQRKFSDLSNADLDILVCTYKMDKPESGIRYLVGFLRTHGVRVQKRDVLQSIRRVDGLGRTIRQQAAIRHRKYTSSRPNALWHCDGHHKLILWGIVIHGFVDGYCRTVRFLFGKTLKLLTPFVRLSECRQALTTVPKLYSTSFFKRLTNMACHPGSEVIEAAKTLMCLFG